MTPLRPALIAITLIALGGLGAGGGAPAARADPPRVGYPSSMAALGDSITRAVNSSGLGDRPENSWSTGTSPSVNSVYSRILAQNPAISGNNFNDAVSGARMTHLDGQAATAVGQAPELVTVLMGANDVCTSSEAAMTPLDTFRSQFEQAMATLSAGLPDARIAVGSIPDIYNLWAILKDNSSARFIWGLFSICQSMLANPTSTDPADVQRRANVRQRNMEFNDVLAQVCAQYIHCRFDDYAGFNLAFTPDHVSAIDYFHPSVAGQALAAGVGWTIYDLTDAAAPVSTASLSPAGGISFVTLSATDESGLSGIEYRLNGSAWQRYAAPLSLPVGDILTYRAVDVNGNVEGSHTCRVPAWAVSPGDSDCDGFLDASESFMGTDPDDGCGPNAWPPDNNDDTHANLADILRYIPVFGAREGDGVYSRRFDLNADGTIGLADVLAYIPFFGATCTL